MSKLIRTSVEEMQGYVPGEQPRGDEIVKLNTNENPYLPSPEVLDILREIDVAELGRYPDPVSLEHPCKPQSHLSSQKDLLEPYNILI